MFFGRNRRKKTVQTAAIGFTLDGAQETETEIPLLEDKERKNGTSPIHFIESFHNCRAGRCKAAVQKHPKFKVDPPQGVTFSWLIRGFPIPDNLLTTVTMGETQAFANEIAGHLGSAQPGASAGGAQGVIYSSGRHVILGIPPAESFLLEK